MIPCCKYGLWLLLVCFVCKSFADQPDSTRQQVLLNMLRHDCGACHGLNLKGGLGPPLSARTFSIQPEKFWVNTILEGRPGTAMPPWKAFITESEAFWLIEQIIKN